MESSPDGKKNARVSLWVKQPAVWLPVVASLAAVIISASTYYQVYERQGELRIIMADKVGVTLLKNGSALLLIPLVFTNTGASRSVNHVTHMTATMRSLDPQNLAGSQVEFFWRLERTMIGKFQYLQKYPDRAESKKENDAGSDIDVLDYVGRTFPFALYGGASVNKLFDFVQQTDRFQPTLRSFELEVRAETDSKPVSSKPVKYVCDEEPKLEVDSFTYCRRLYQ